MSTLKKKELVYLSCLTSNIFMNIYLCRKGTEDREFVLSSDANSAIPEMVIKYCESQVIWKCKADNNE